MKIKLNFVKVSSLALIAFPFVSIAAPNPVSWNKMVQYMTLTQADWQAVCQSGNINSTEGCYGDAGSEAFAKINRLGGNPLGYAGVTGSAENSVWVRQVGAGTSCTMTNKDIRITNVQGVSNSTIWICGVELTNGSSVSSAYSLGAINGDQARGPGVSPSLLFTTIPSGNLASIYGQKLTNNALYFSGSAALPTAYVFCVSTTSTSAATAFTPQAPQTVFQGQSPC